MRLDDLDARILGLLQQDARLSLREMAARLGSTTPTVGARVRALEDTGVIRGYRVDLDPSAWGGATYVLDVRVHPKDAEDAHAAIAALPGVHAAHLLAGGRIVAHAHLRPPQATLALLHAELARVPGLQTYDASEVLRSGERADVGEIPTDVAVPCAQCKGPIHGDPVKGRFGERTHVFCCRGCLGAFRARHEAASARAARRPGKRA